MPFEVLAQVYDPPSNANADFIVHSPYAAFVIDGASSLHGETVDGQPAAAWLATQLGKRLAAFDGGDIDSFVQTAMAEIARVFGGKVPTQNADAYPFCCVVGCIEHEDAIELVSWGDCQAIVHDVAADRYELFGYCSVGLLDDAVLRSVQKAKAERGLDHRSALASCYAQIDANRVRRNVDRSYQILDLTPPRVGVAERRFLDKTRPWRIMLTSDGLFRAVAAYGLDTIETFAGHVTQPQLAQLLAKVRTLEAQDPDCEAYPRLKPSDDVSAIVLDYTPVELPGGQS